MLALCAAPNIIFVWIADEQGDGPSEVGGDDARVWNGQRKDEHDRRDEWVSGLSIGN